MLTTPVLLIIFNQPETTQRVFDAIRLAQPRHLYVSADGPRHDKPGEREQCAVTRTIIDQVDWDCEVKTLFREENLGVVPAVLGGIDWFFGQVDEGIILESDCLPHPDFWQYANELLERYRHTEAVKAIGGNNFQHGIRRGDGSYYFSAMLHIWGWATWRRTWRQVDIDIARRLSLPQARALIKDRFMLPDATAYWMQIFRYVREGRPHMWDYRVLFSIWKQNGCCIVPNVNLVTNIGFHPDAISTRDMNSPFANLPLQPILPLQHPSAIQSDTAADQYYYEHYLRNTLSLKGWKYMAEKWIPFPVRKAIRRMIRKIKNQ